jgi:alkylation response protein AidB-like acyl-CoA dehydrogenase
MAALLDAAAVVAGRAVDVVYDVSHQVHGAIGFTQEYALHRHSLDLLRWRDHLQLLRGGELRCAERLGDAALEAGSLWRAVTSVMKPGDSHE